MRKRARTLSVALLVVVTALSGTVAVVQSARLAAARRDEARLHARIERLEADLAQNAARSTPDPSTGRKDSPDGKPFGGPGEPSGGGVVECLSADATPGATASARGGSAPDQVRDIAAAVEELRDLDFDERVRPTFLPREKVARRAARLFLAEYPEKVAAAEARLLRALGAIPPGLDLRATVRQLLETQVAGFYVPETGRLVVPSRDTSQPLSAAEKIIVAHELQHALAHQSLGLPLPDEPEPARLDENLAAVSLVEGDATLTMQRYAVASIPVLEQLSLLSDPLVSGSRAGLEGVPYYLAQQLQFPYIAGLQFTCDRYAKRKWKAVDRAYARPPAATDQILFPERYGEGAPVRPRLPAAPGRRWKEEWSSSFGAAHLLWLFEAPGGDESRGLEHAKEKVAAWGGGHVRVWSAAERSALGLSLTQRRGEKGLCDAVAEWYDAAFPAARKMPPAKGERLVRDGAEADAVLRCGADGIRLGIAPHIAAARRITG